MSVIHISPQDIPSRLRILIPLAEKFGVSDDLSRETLIRHATEEERQRLKAAVRESDDELDVWLAGPEADGPNHSDGYIAFSAMRKAADYI